MAGVSVNHQVKNADKMPLRFHENGKPGQETKDKKIESASSKLHYIRDMQLAPKYRRVAGEKRELKKRKGQGQGIKFPSN